MAPTSETASLEQGISRAIFEEAERLKEVTIQRAVAEYESQLREMIAKTSMKLTSFYEMERRGTNLVITVKVGD